MSPSEVILLAFLIGVVSGLRSLTAPAAVAWAAHLGWIKLGGRLLAFMGSTAAVAIFTLAGSRRNSWPINFLLRPAERRPRD